MKTKTHKFLSLKSLVAFILLSIFFTAITSCDQATKKEPADAKQPTEKVAQKKYKMTTQIPENVLIPDKVETRLGTLEFFDGVPTAETAEKIWDNQDFSRAVESMIMCTPAASLAGFRRGIREFGPDNETAIIWESRLGF